MYEIEDQEMTLCTTNTNTCPGFKESFAGRPQAIVSTHASKRMRCFSDFSLKVICFTYPK